MEDKFEIGKIVNTFGIKGEVKILPYTEDVNSFKKMKYIYVNDLKIKIQSVKFHKNFVILKLEGIEDMTSAENLRNSIIKIERKKEKLPENTYYIKDLIGLEVITDDDGNTLGVVKDIYNTGANDIYTIETKEGKEILLPAIKEVIKEVDIENRKIIVHILKGLI